MKLEKEKSFHQLLLFNISICPKESCLYPCKLAYFLTLSKRFFTCSEILRILEAANSADIFSLSEVLPEGSPT
jgi:hypothetical protein